MYACQIPCVAVLRRIVIRGHDPKPFTLNPKPTQLDPTPSNYVLPT